MKDECPICGGSGADFEKPHCHIFKCERCGGTGKETLKAGPVSTKAKCMKCEGRGTWVTAKCDYVSEIITKHLLYIPYSVMGKVGVFRKN